MGNGTSTNNSMPSDRVSNRTPIWDSTKRECKSEETWSEENEVPWSSLGPGYYPTNTDYIEEHRLSAECPTPRKIGGRSNRRISTKKNKNNRKTKNKRYIKKQSKLRNKKN